MSKVIKALAVPLVLTVAWGLAAFLDYLAEQDQPDPEGLPDQPGFRVNRERRASEVIPVLTDHQGRPVLPEHLAARVRRVQSAPRVIPDHLAARARRVR